MPLRVGQRVLAPRWNIEHGHFIAEFEVVSRNTELKTLTLREVQVRYNDDRGWLSGDNRPLTVKFERESYFERPLDKLIAEAKEEMDDLLRRILSSRDR